MNEMTKNQASSSLLTIASLEASAQQILLDTQTDIVKENSITLPIAKLSALGSASASLIPKLRTVTSSFSINTEGVFRLANAMPGDALKSSKDGLKWGAMRTADGGSKMAKLAEVDSLTSTASTVMPLNPAVLMIAGAIYSIDKKLDEIKEIGESIISFLEIEKQSEIEADVETLSGIISRFKYNWDNDHFVTSNHKLALDIKRTARKHLHSYQKTVEERIGASSLLVGQSKVKKALADLVKDFKYYRLSLFNFSLSSFSEILLSGNYSEENLSASIAEIETLSVKYRDLFDKSSAYLEELGKASVEAKLLKGVGSASNAVGNLIGSIPVVKNKSADEFLIKQGKTIIASAEDMKKGAAGSFAALGNPNTSPLLSSLKDLDRICNHTSAICFDRENVYLLSD